MILILLLLVAITHNQSQPQPYPPDNCLVLNPVTGSTCSQCAPGFYLEYFLCFPCAPLCLCSTQYNYCESCISLPYQSNNNYTAIHVPNQKRCVLCYALIPNCLKCRDITHCDICFGGYYLVPTNGGAVCSNTTCQINCDICSSSTSC